MALRNRLRKVSQKSRKRIKKFFGKTIQKNFARNFSYQINLQSKQYKIRRNSQRGIL